MELVKITTGEPTTPEQIEADWISVQPATVTVEQDVDGETVPVEIENHVDFRLPGDLTGIDLAPYGAAIVEPVDPPEADDGEVAVRDGIEQYEPGKWRMTWIVRECSAGEFEAHERDLHLQVDAEAGAFRARFITDVPGQQQTYAEKEAEARAYLLNPEGDYVFLTAEAAARGVAVADVAALVIATADAWRPLGAAIEGRRMGAKAAVTMARQSGDWAAMDAAATVDWEALAIP